MNASMPRKYLVMGCRSWNRKLFDEVIRKNGGEWYFIGSREELTPATVRAIDPRFIFFLHWSWKVPDEIVDSFECVCFHMTDVPYGRGGSPLQNLIVRGHQDTMVTALRMTHEFDAGPVYLKEPLTLEGRATALRQRRRTCSQTAINLSPKGFVHVSDQASYPVPKIH